MYWDENLDEDELTEQIKKLQEQCERYEEEMAEWQDICSTCLEAGYSGSVSLLDSYRDKIENLKVQINELEKKKAFLIETDDSTSMLFCSVTDSLDIIHNLINQSGLCLEGKSAVGALVGLTLVSNEINRIAKLKLEALLMTEIGIDLVTFEELYGEAALTQLIIYAKNEVRQSGTINTQNLLINIVEMISGYAVEVIDEKYQLNDGEWYLLKRYSKQEIITLIKSGESVDDTPEIISKEMLKACGWDETLLTDEMMKECNSALNKYEINTTERISHFIAQCSFESVYGEKTYEQGSTQYFNGKKYGSKYRGVGYIHITWDYAYQAFATYLILEEYPELGEYKNPSNSSAAEIKSEYDNIVNAANSKNIDIEEYTKIVDIGYQYVSDNFAWESSGYYWSIIAELNQIVDSGGTADDVSDGVNHYDKKTFSKRENIYNNIVNNNIFDNLGVGKEDEKKTNQ